MKQKLKKLFAMLLTISMVAGMLSTVSFAEGETAVPDEKPNLYIYRVGTVDEDGDGQPDLKSNGLPKAARYADQTRTYDSVHHIEYNFYYPGSGNEVTNGRRHNHNVSSGLFEMVHSESLESFPTYCVDFMISAVGDHAYKRLNLEESTYFDSDLAPKIRGVVNQGYWVDWTEDAAGFVTDTVPADVIDDANDWLEEQGMEPLSNLTANQALTATQVAIWSLANSEDYKYYVTPNFAVDQFGEVQTLVKEILALEGSLKNGEAVELIASVRAKQAADEELTEAEQNLLKHPALDTYEKIAKAQKKTNSFVFNTVYTPNSANTKEATENIDKFCAYLLEQRAEPLTRDSIIITDDYFVLSDAVFTESETDEFGAVKYNVTLQLKLAADINVDRDDLTLKAVLGDQTKEYALTGDDCAEANESGYYAVCFESLSEEAVSSGIQLTLSGDQYVDGVYFYEAEPNDPNDSYSPRESAQNMVGRYVGTTPVFVEKGIDVELGNKDITLIKYDGEATPSDEITNENTVEVSNKFYPALSGVTFDLYAEKGSNEFCIKSGLVTDAQGKITVTGLPDGYDYFFKEVSTLPGYECDPDVKHTITWPDGTVTVENCYDLADLTLSKTVEGVPTDEHFIFTVTLDLSTADLVNAESVIAPIFAADWDGIGNNCFIPGEVEGDAPTALHQAEITFAQEGESLTAEVVLKDGESLTIKGIPTGTTYTVTEADNDYTPAGGATQSGTVGEDAEEASFRNFKYNYHDDNVEILAKKTVDGQAPGGRTFTFELSKWDGEKWIDVTSARNDANGGVAFKLTYTTPGEDIYRILEVNDGGDYVYDNSIFYAKVKVTGSREGNLSASVKYYEQFKNGAVSGAPVMTPPTFNNQTYKQSSTPDDAQWRLTGAKTLDGEKAGGFTFRMVSEMGDVSVVTSKDDGSITFPRQSFDKKGTYTYTITEVAGEDESIVYDPAVYTVTVTVEKVKGDYEVTGVVITKDGEAAEVVSFENTTKTTEIPEDPTPTDDKPGDKDGGKNDDEIIFEEDIPLADAPATGDISAVWLALSAVSGAGLAGTTFLGRKKREEE